LKGRWGYLFQTKKTQKRKREKKKITREQLGVSSRLVAADRNPWVEKNYGGGENGISTDRCQRGGGGRKIQRFFKRFFKTLLKSSGQTSSAAEMGRSGFDTDYLQHLGGVKDMRPGWFVGSDAVQKGVHG